jgi:hypothetical protein
VRRESTSVNDGRRLLRLFAQSSICCWSPSMAVVVVVVVVVADGAAFLRCLGRRGVPKRGQHTPLLTIEPDDVIIPILDHSPCRFCPRIFCVLGFPCFCLPCLFLVHSLQHCVKSAFYVRRLARPPQGPGTSYSVYSAPVVPAEELLFCWASEFVFSQAVHPVDLSFNQTT